MSAATVSAWPQSSEDGLGLGDGPVAEPFQAVPGPLPSSPLATTELPIARSPAPPTAPTGEPTAALWQRFFDGRDRDVRAELTAAYLSLVRYVAARMLPLLPGHVERDSLTHWGVFGLVDAIDRFEPDRGVQFETFAVPRIKGAILDAVRSDDWAPRSVRARARALATASAQLETRLKRAPTTDEIVAEMGISRQAFERLRVHVARGTVDELQLDEADHLLDHSTDPAAAFEAAEELRVLREGIADLPDRQRQVLELYYFDELTLREIADVLGVSEGRVSRIRSRAIRSMLDRMRAGEPAS
jgi:RNA polymerase sigma factor FliA